jgi:alpha-tubulin suppressor-like RCC1 family protein
VQVGALTTWSKIAAGEKHTVAIKTDGTLWSWGWNDYGGRLGQGNTTDRSSPVQVGALTDWLSVTGNYYSTISLRN